MDYIGILFIIAMGAVMILKPIKVWEFVYSSKKKKPDPTVYYLFMLRIGGLVLFAGGITALVFNLAKL